jgi:hemerythrin-like metal-binding protein
LLTDLLAYALYHFETEEALMLEFDYAGSQADIAERHVAQHREFAATAARMREQFLATGDLDRNALLAFLNNWLTGHILGLDQRLGEYLLSKGWHE